MDNGKLHSLTVFIRREPATAESVRKLEDSFGVALPMDYVKFLMSTNGGEGFGEAGYVMLWGTSELISLNDGYEIARSAPGFLLIGSDGCGEAYGFDTRDSRWTVVQAPFVGIDWGHARYVSGTFGEFIGNVPKSAPADALAERNATGLRSPTAKEIFEITPVILGGDPIAPENKMLLGRDEHIQAVVFWNNKICEVRASGE